MLDRVFGRFRRKRGGALAGDDFVVDNNRINVAATRTPSSAIPVNLIRLFWLADRHNLPINPDATRLATRSLRLDRPDLAQGSRRPTSMFLDILTSRNSPEVVLRRMNEAGVLGRFIPDFGRIVAMMQFNMYHHYTVDEHLLRVGRRADRDRGGTARRASIRWRTRSSATIRNRRALYVADVPARHRQGPAGGSFAGRCRHRAASSGRASA